MSRLFRMAFLVHVLTKFSPIAAGGVRMIHGTSKSSLSWAENVLETLRSDVRIFIAEELVGRAGVQRSSRIEPVCLFGDESGDYWLFGLVSAEQASAYSQLRLELIRDMATGVLRPIRGTPVLTVLKCGVCAETLSGHYITQPNGAALCSKCAPALGDTTDSPVAECPACGFRFLNDQCTIYYEEKRCGHCEESFAVGSPLFM